jgi:radical SAM superfamily enzyme YgiQ (UPF0313 family)
MLMRKLASIPQIGRSTRTLLVRPPQKFFNARFPQGPRLSAPLGIIAIASFLRDHGHSAEVFDAFVEGQQFANFVAGTDSVHGVLAADKEKMTHFGASWDEVKAAMVAANPDVIGIAAIFDETIEDVIMTARIARQAVPDALIIIGGPSASTNAGFYLEEGPEIDVVCCGDGEETSLELVEWIEGRRPLSEVCNISYRHDIGLCKGKDRILPMGLDYLGHIDYALVDIERYFALEERGIMSRQRFLYKGSERAISIITSRGCPYYCSFCSVHIHAGRKYRTFSAQHVLDHLDTLVRKLGVKHIHFEDDNLTLDRKRFMEIADGVAKRGLKFTWDTPNGVHANTLTEDMLVKMKEMGCIYLVVAVESGDQWVIDNVINKKPMKLENVLNVFLIGKRIGLDLQAFYVIGFPRENMSQIQTTLDFAMKGLLRWNVVPHVQIVMANAGTDLYKEATSMGMLAVPVDGNDRNSVGIRTDHFARPVISTAEFTAKQLHRLNNSYHRKFIAILFLKLLGFSLQHPLIVLKNVPYFIKARQQMNTTFVQTGMILFFTRLLYPQALRRETSLK